MALVQSDWSSLREIAAEAFSLVAVKSEGYQAQNIKTLYLKHLVLGVGDTPSTDDVTIVDPSSTQVTAIGTSRGNTTVDISPPPSPSETVYVSYKYTQLDHDDIISKRSKAIDYIQRCLKGRVDYTGWDTASIPPIIKQITTWLAASYLLSAERILDVEAPNEPDRKASRAKMALDRFIKDEQGTTGSLRVTPIVGAGQTPESFL